ncbi:hypothetical protein ZIOFF_073021 [Zingiber officinale]|uniref:GH16 domain-containing protein n=1 Tax=Zingiber officinale TaxID=94328 RepID=A0A8J5E9X9_ZINOF|nr:hypothetical protein ZIOFF_073021 [Zingiber officinale]
MRPSHEAAFLSELPNLATISFEEGYTQLFGDSNLILHGDGRTVHLSLDQRIGAAFASQDLYLHGFFSASIKLPSDYVAGVVVAFYVCFFTREFRFCSLSSAAMGSAMVLASLYNGGAASASASSRSGTKDPPQNLASGGGSRLRMSAASQIKSPPCTRLFIPSGNRSEVDPEKLGFDLV